MGQLRTQMPQVALVLPTSIKTCRELLRGILQFVHLHGPWAVHIIEGREGEQKLLRPAAWGCTGMIVDMLGERHSGERLLTTHLPTVIVNSMGLITDPVNPLSKLSRVDCDNFPIGKTAADYFLKLGFSSFAFVGEVNDVTWSEERRTAFCARLHEDGFACEVYPRLPLTARKDFSVEQETLCGWLKALPKPVALFAANDVRGRQVLDSCLKVGVPVPQEAAVLGVDNDELLCETTNPPLSSIQMNTEQAGFEAARLLDGMMRRHRRGKPRQTTITYGFSHLVERRSTQTVQVSDTLVVHALEFMRINAGTALTVKDVHKHLNVSRRSLETRFKAARGCTVYAEITHARLERVRTLLLETSMTLEAIADTCGFVSASHLGTVFKAHFGMTLSSYRRQHRDGMSR